MLLTCYILHFNSALTKIIKTGFSAINLIYFFTAGPDEVMYLHTYFLADKSCLNFYKFALIFVQHPHQTIFLLVSLLLTVKIVLKYKSS